MLNEQGYFELKEIPGRGLCGLFQFLFTVGLVYGIDEGGYKGRWCYPTLDEARIALKYWDGAQDPIGNWIKYKGEDGERSNPLKYKYEDTSGG